MSNDQNKYDRFLLSRKEFLASLAAVSVSASAKGAMAAPVPASTATKSTGRPKIGAFIKFLQEMTPDEMAAFLADSGFDGVEATVRDNGYILPGDVTEKLPRFAEALDKRGLKIFTVTTDIVSVASPHAEKVLKTVKSLGVPRYRLGFLKYDLTKPVADQLYALRPSIAELAQLNKTHGIMGVYQNHGGADFVGAALWDYYELIKDIPREQMSFVYDTWHATSAGGTTWESTLNLATSHLGFVSVKDFKWTQYEVEGVPLGTGMVNPRIFKKIRDVYAGEYSLHIEYAEKAGLAANKAAFARDINVLKNLLG